LRVAGARQHRPHRALLAAARAAAIMRCCGAPSRGSPCSVQRASSGPAGGVPRVRQPLGQAALACSAGSCSNRAHDAPTSSLVAHASQISKIGGCVYWLCVALSSFVVPMLVVSRRLHNSCALLSPGAPKHALRTIHPSGPRNAAVLLRGAAVVNCVAARAGLPIVGHAFCVFGV
jgi:hypothetical protein